MAKLPQPSPRAFSVAPNVLLTPQDIFRIEQATMRLACLRPCVVAALTLSPQGLVQLANHRGEDWMLAMAEQATDFEACAFTLAQYGQAAADRVLRATAAIVGGDRHAA